MQNILENTNLEKVCEIYAKIECTNPTGSIKDRFIFHWFDDMERDGRIKIGDTIIEASSGNTGISLAYFGRKLGYKVKVIMPENMSVERKKLIRKPGAELIECKAGDFKLAAMIRDEEIKRFGYKSPLQFSNPLNVETHYLTTAKEIVYQFEEINPGRSIDVFVAGVGTGGTLIGVAKRLKEMYPNVRIIAVEPEESAVMSGKLRGKHSIQGIGDGFIPDIVRGNKNGLNELIDEVATVHSDAAIETARELAKKGYGVGISSGANFAVAQRYLRRGNNVVTIFPDDAKKYKTLGL